MRTLLVAAVGLMLAAPAAWARRPEPNPDMTGKRELRMANCPSAVDGAYTEVSDLPNGVVVTVRGLDPIAIVEVRRRVQFQLEIAERPERGAIEHTGVGTGSGRYGFCPGMLEGTRFDVTWTSDGARMYVRADDDETVARLKKSARKRAAALNARRLQAAVSP